MKAIRASDTGSHIHIDEACTLATELARAYREMATFYHDKLELSGPEADARARGLGRVGKARAIPGSWRA